MAVPKIAVMALVAIVAAPILLGYAMALEPTTEYRYVEGEKTNITPLIQNSKAYDLSAANIYLLNSDVFLGDSDINGPAFYPYYVSSGTAVSPIVRSSPYAYRTMPYAVDMSNVYYASGFVTGNNYSSASYAYAEVYDVNNVLLDTVPGIRYYSFTDSDKLLRVAYQSNLNDPNSIVTKTIQNADSIFFYNYGSGVWNAGNWWDNKAWDDSIRSASNLFADLSAGYTMNIDRGLPLGLTPDKWRPDNYVEDFLYTFDLATMSGSFALNIYTENASNTLDTSDADMNGVRTIYLTQSGSTWYLMDQNNNVVDTIIYNPGMTNNVYQIKVTHSGFELRYVGYWPNQIAEANYYRTWQQDFTNAIPSTFSIKYVKITAAADGLMRFDAASYRSYTYNVTEDYTYNPAQIIGSDNTNTTIEAMGINGTSIIFGGNTYTVANGGLYVGGQKYSFTGMTFSSTMNSDGDFENRINGDLISTTATPSTIQFNGKWVMNVTSSAMTSESYTTTKWTAGQFAWDGMDQNFLIVGLITCLGVFIALGIYARKKGSGGIIPLMIAVGCAAAVFFIML